MDIFQQHKRSILSDLICRLQLSQFIFTYRGEGEDSSKSDTCMSIMHIQYLKKNYYQRFTTSTSHIQYVQITFRLLKGINKDYVERKPYKLQEYFSYYQLTSLKRVQFCTYGCMCEIQPLPHSQRNGMVINHFTMTCSQYNPLTAHLNIWD